MLGVDSALRKNDTRKWGEAFAMAGDLIFFYTKVEMSVGLMYQ